MANLCRPRTPHHGAKKRVFIVEEHPLLRQGLALLIGQQQDLEVVAEADDAQTALQVIAHSRPDLMTVGISLKGADDGFDLLKSIRALYGALPVLILSSYDESIYAERAVRTGANGYIMKQAVAHEVLVAVRRTLNGGMYLSDKMSNKMLRQSVGVAPAPAHSRISDLSEREFQVFTLVGEGHGTRQIADQLRLSVKTIETYQTKIKEKLFFRNGRELIQRAIQWKNEERAF